MPANFYYDALLWVDFLIIGFASYYRIPAQLTRLHNLGAVEDPNKTPGPASKQTEKAIDTESLAVLTKSSNVTLRTTAVKILLDRLLGSPTAWDLLLQDLSSKNGDGRRRALCLINLLRSESSAMLTHPKFCDLAFLSALITCLVNLLPDFKATESERRYPTDAEKTALEITGILLQNPSKKQMNRLLDLGFIESWLQYYPFLDEALGGRAKDDIVRDLVLNDECEFWRSRHLKFIFLSLIANDTGMAKLSAVGLWHDEPKPESEGGEHLRHIEASGASLALRRRRREAIVVGVEVLQAGEESHDLQFDGILDSLREAPVPTIQASSARHIESWLRRRLPLQ